MSGPDRRRSILVAVGLLISTGALALLIASIDLAAATNAIATANPLLLAAIPLVVAVQVAIRSARWSILLSTDDGHPIPPRRLVQPLLIGYLGNAVLPARLGEPIRAALASKRESVGMLEALGSVLVERMIDVATLAPFAYAAAVLVAAPSWVLQTLGIAALGGVAVLVVLVSVGVNPVLRVLDRFDLTRWARGRTLVTRFVAVLRGRSRRSRVAAAIGLSGVVWILDAISFWLAATAVGAGLHYGEAVLVAGITVLGTAVPSAPGYVGTFELAATAMAGSLGVPGPQAFAMAILVHVMTLVPMALGGAVSLVLMGASLRDVARTAEISDA